MRGKTRLLAWMASIAIPALLAMAPSVANAQLAKPVTQDMIDVNSIGGVVTSQAGPEAGVWVIAETTDLPTKFAKMVVTDDFGRYVIPELPKANFSIWVRGYGLVDSMKVKANPGQVLNLKAVVAPTLKDAAQYYPAIYWYSMLKIPDKSMFPGTGTGPSGNGMSETFKSQEQWLNLVGTNGCTGCHQLGNFATRTIPGALGHFDNMVDAWTRRISSGQAATNMINTINGMETRDGGQIAYLADWTDRIAKGEIPSSAPQRPAGTERNVVVTVRDWSDPKHYLHDLISTDKRNPTVNANGPVYGATELSTPNIPVLDPVKNVKTTIRLPVRDADTPSSLAANPLVGESPYWGDEVLWDSQVNAHSDTMDQDGRVWWVSQIRSPQNPPAFCAKGGGNPSADYYPQDQKQGKPGDFTQNSRQVTFYEPKTQKFGMIDICFNAQHLNFAEDANNTLWIGGNSGGNRGVVGWINTKLFLETGDASKSQGWAPLIVDTNGNGKADAWVDQGQPNDGTKDTRLPLGLYAVSWAPDGTVWGSSNNGFPGQIFRITLGNNPPSTVMTEIYKVPLPGFGVRGLDVDRQGVAWVPLDSGHIGSFDRKKCKGPLNGPGADQGLSCPEGWTFYNLPGPGYQGYSAAAESIYYTWVDQHDVLGLGKDVPLGTGNESDAVFAIQDGRVLTLRVPYPMGFFAKWMDGRIDDPNAGWKGRGLWVSSGNRAAFHIEGIDAKVPGAPGSTKETLSSPLVFHFQVRPDPLAH